VYALSDPIETLLSSAEISAALLGTVAIVSVFRGGERRWRPEGRFWVMVVLASSTFGLALLPIPFIAAEASPSMTWSIPALFVVASTIGVTRLSFWGMRVQEGLGIKTHVPTLLGFLVFLVTAVIMSLLNLGVSGTPAFWRHLTAVMSIQAATVLFFVRLLRLWLIDTRDDDTEVTEVTD
jgi:hypothetical protein